MAAYGGLDIVFFRKFFRPGKIARVINENHSGKNRARQCQNGNDREKPSQKNTNLALTAVFCEKRFEF